MSPSAKSRISPAQKVGIIGYSIFKTAWGPFAIVSRQSALQPSVRRGSTRTIPELLATFLPGPTASQIKLSIESRFPNAVKDDDVLADLQDDVKRYFAGDRVNFRATLDLSDRTPFQQAVIAACRRIRPGKVMSYAALAVAAGYPRAARAVGSVMSNNRTPLIVPCHRVVSAGGLGGFSASGGLDLKQALLELEGAVSTA